MTHALKTWPQFYKDVESGSKTFEVRKNDRPFKVGDTLLLQEYSLGGTEPTDDPLQGKYSGKEIRKRIIYILNGGQFGIEKGYVVLGFEEIEF